MGAFDDLIPGGKAKAGGNAKPSRGGSFDDLVPQGGATPRADFSGVTSRVDQGAAVTKRKPGRLEAIGNVVRAIPSVKQGLGVLDGFQHNLMNIPAGINQLEDNVISGVTNFFAPNSGIAQHRA